MCIELNDADVTVLASKVSHVIHDIFINLDASYCSCLDMNNEPSGRCISCVYAVRIAYCVALRCDARAKRHAYVTRTPTRTLNVNLRLLSAFCGLIKCQPHQIDVVVLLLLSLSSLPMFSFKSLQLLLSVAVVLHSPPTLSRPLLTQPSHCILGLPRLFFPSNFW